ncbi:hypothetical protein [Pseudomonas alkylphenolica]|nr:hypothetical protein [Pseudomonas alkylphenolica]
MNEVFFWHNSKDLARPKSMQEFGEAFVGMLPRHLDNLKVPGRLMGDGSRNLPLHTKVEHVAELQIAMRDVLSHSITRNAQSFAEDAFRALLERDSVDAGVLKFFNGWNETHKTTSLVSAKVIMRLSADSRFISVGGQEGHNRVMAHMHEVAKDDFGLGHEGHDGMYAHMTAAFDASDWVRNSYEVNECCEFSRFLYEVGVAHHNSAVNSLESKNSIMNAMMISVASELWNGSEYNFLAQFIEKKLISINASLSSDIKSLRDAKGYVLGHSGDVENKHGMHALAATQAYGRTVGLGFEVSRLKEVMLDYNARVGKAFSSLCRALNE